MAKGTKAAATATGAAKGALKALEGYPGIFHHLAREHGEVAAMMKRISQSDGSTRDEVFPELRRNLLAHAHAEEQEFYSQLRNYAELEELVAQCIAEHKDVESQLDRLDTMDKHSDTWTELFERMQQAVEAHVDREEQELFPKARDLMTREEANEMFESYEDVEQREKAAL